MAGRFLRYTVFECACFVRYAATQQQQLNTDDDTKCLCTPWTSTIATNGVLQAGVPRLGHKSLRIIPARAIRQLPTLSVHPVYHRLPRLLSVARNGSDPVSVCLHPQRIQELRRSVLSRESQPT